jgi:hypothetical protein
MSEWSSLRTQRANKRMAMETASERDILEKLRDYAEWAGQTGQPGTHDACMAAISEIERLRAELSGARQHGEIGQPVLTDAEREAVELAAEDCRYHQDPGGRAAFIEATLRGLLERLGGLPERDHPARKEWATPARSGETGGDSPDRE